MGIRSPDHSRIPLAQKVFDAPCNARQAKRVWWSSASSSASRIPYYPRGATEVIGTTSVDGPFREMRQHSMPSPDARRVHWRVCQVLELMHCSRLRLSGDDSPLRARIGALPALTSIAAPAFFCLALPLSPPPPSGRPAPSGGCFRRRASSDAQKGIETTRCKGGLAPKGSGSHSKGVPSRQKVREEEGDRERQSTSPRLFCYRWSPSSRPAESSSKTRTIEALTCHSDP